MWKKAKGVSKLINMKHPWKFRKFIYYITVETHQREEDVSMMKKLYDLKMRVRDPGQQTRMPEPLINAGSGPRVNLNSLKYNSRFVTKTLVEINKKE